MIAHVLDDKLPLKPGDVIDEIDGKDEREFRRKIDSLFAASTPQAALGNASYHLFRGPKDSIAAPKSAQPAW